MSRVLRPAMQNQRMLPMVFTSDSIALALWTQRHIAKAGSKIGELR
jgi:hypothetical protein